MAPVSQVRNRFVVVVLIFLVIDVAAVAFLLSPWGRAPEQRIDEYNRARNERNQKEHDVQPLTGLPEKLNAVAWAMLPTFRPPISAPPAWQASSTTFNPCRSARSTSAGMFAGRP